MKAAGTDTDTEVSREARTAAYAPYYRKLTTRPDPDANNTKWSIKRICRVLLE